MKFSLFSDLSNLWSCLCIFIVSLATQHTGTLMRILLYLCFEWIKQKNVLYPVLVTQNWAKRKRIHEVPVKTCFTRYFMQVNLFSIKISFFKQVFTCIFIKLTNQRGYCWLVSPKFVLSYIQKPIQILMYPLTVELPVLHSKNNTILKHVEQIACLPSLKSNIKYISISLMLLG